MEDYQISSFSSGELTPRASGRMDTPAYLSGAKSIHNGIVLPQGGVTRRPGSEKLDQVSGRLIDFEGNDVVGYVLAITTTEINIYLEGILFDTVAVTWTQAQIDLLDYAISGNIMFFTVQGAKTKLLTYITGISFSIADYNPTYVNCGDYDNQDLAGADLNNCAGSVTFYEDRAVFAGSINHPTHIWGTEVGAYDSFLQTDPLNDNDSYEFKIADRISPKIEWIVGARGIFCGTNRGVYSISDSVSILTPTRSSIPRKNSSYPVGNTTGIQLGGELFYIQKGKRKVRMAGYDRDKDIYLTPDITNPAEHITKGLIKEIAVQTLPETIFWAVLENGELITFSYNMENKVNAWSRHTTNGLYKSICIVREGETEVVYTIVERDSIDYLERFYPIDFDNLEYKYVDSSVEVEFAPATDIVSITDGVDIVVESTTHGLLTGDFLKIMDTGNEDFDYGIFGVEKLTNDTFNLLDEITGQKPVITSFSEITKGTIQKADNVITGLDHLDGKDVFVMSGPTPVGPETVVSNGIIVEGRKTEFTVGYNYYSDIIPMNLALGKNKRKRNIHVTVEVLDSLGGKSGKDEDHLNPFVYEKTITMDNPQELFSGSIRMPHLGGSEFAGDILIRQDIPLPLTVLSLAVEVEVF